MGPKETALRARMKSGRVLSKAEASRDFGAVGEAIWSRLLRTGASMPVQGGATLRERFIDTADLAVARQERERKAALVKATEAERAAALARTQEREASRRAQLAALDAARTPEERARVVQESRLLALAERVPAAPSSGDPLLDLFADLLDLDTSPTRVAS